MFGLLEGGVGAVKLASDAGMAVDRALGFDNEGNVIDQKAY